MKLQLCTKEVDVSIQPGRVARTYTLPAPQRGRGAARRQTSTTVQEDNPEEGPSAAAGTPAPSSPADSDITASQDTDPGEGPCTRPPSVVSGATSESPTLGEDEDQQGEEQQRDEEGDADYGERPLRRPPQRAARTHEAYLRTAARTHELMAERTEVLRRMTDLRLQQQGDHVCGRCQAALPPPSPELLSSSHLPQPMTPPSPVRGRCMREGGLGPTSSPVATHSQLMEASHSHLLEAACPPSPELLACREFLEPPTPPPLVQGKQGQRRGAAAPSFATVLTHSQLKELARPPSPELLTCSQPMEQAAAAPPVRGKRAQKRGVAGPLLPQCSPQPAEGP
uniref:Uncharacterized protein n=1 Tax=Sphaerodactylus townsendi TaxID=933632 RepID=A0ACB8G1T4_9SAUR